MLMDTDKLDIIKGITRKEAKAVHKDLPEGGVWRTIKGHHVYIKDGKVLAGSIPGVTKAKKATKAHLKEHQAHIDSEGRKKGTKKDEKGKGKTAGKTAKSKPAGSGAKKAASGKAGAKKAGKDSAGGKTAKQVKGKANGTTKVGAKTDGKKSVKPTAKSGTTGKSVQATGKKKSTSEGGAKSNPAAKEGRQLEIFHGTALPYLDSILKKGFKVNGGHSDFGNAAYFKSPDFDAIDHKDHQDWIKEREAKGQPVFEDDRARRGSDTEDIVRYFTSRDNPLVVKALVPKEHVLDCTNGRPKELQKLIDDHANYELEGTIEAMMGFVLKHIVGADIRGMNEDQLDALFHMPEMQKALTNFWGRPLHPFKVSPYEVYAKKNGVKAIVDKLDTFTYEGWQIGVYDPSLIKITDHGKDVRYNPDKKTAELIKALQKALPYCLMGHEMTDEGLVMHIGVAGEKDIPEGVKKSLMKKVLASGSGDVSAVYDKELRKARIALSKGHDLFSPEYRGKLGAGLAHVGGNYNAGRSYLNAKDLRELGSEHMRNVEAGRNAYRLDWTQINPNDDILYIPLNRLRRTDQTEKATNWDKVEENRGKMKRGEGLAPIVIGYDHDIKDGQHRWEASNLEGFTHVPCVVMRGTNEIERQRAVEGYQEVWKSIETDPTSDMPGHIPMMYRGIGLRELHAINKSKVIQSKGKGNDDDKGTNTCFSNLFQQAEGYARIQYDLYNEKAAFVLEVERPHWVYEDEHGELISEEPIPTTYIRDIIPVPKDERQNQ